MGKKEYKLAKKSYKKGLRKAERPWNVIQVISCVLSIVLIIATAFMTLFDNTIAAFASGNFMKLTNEDENAQYYQSDFKSNEEMVEYGLDVCQRVEAEGAALLMNNDNALPLKNSRVTLFSNSSVNLVYGGTGSGNIDASKADNLKTALEKAGIKVNKKMWDFYNSKEISEYAREVGGTVSLDAAVISELPWDKYTKDVLSSVEDYSDAAVVVLSRVGGEGADLTYQDTNYLALDKNEKDMMKNLAKMKKDGKLDKIVILINSANPLQVDFLKDNVYSVDAALWIGDVGITGVNAVGQILAGDVNPSGSLVDTYCYNNYSAPAMANFTPITYEGDTSKIPDSADTYMIYQEGIYVGYKYYETRYEDYVMAKGNAGDYKYSDDVAFAFGTGLSYTDFDMSDMSSVYDTASDSFKVSVKVTNTGKVAGKKTVQIYSQSPYTQYDIDNSVEKASVSLVGFGKTKLLKPGQSEVVNILVDKADIASFDAYGAKTYILDQGDYYLATGENAHDAVNNILAAKGYTVANTNNRMDKDGKASLAVKWNQASFDKTTYAKSKAGAKVTSRLQDADINLYPGLKDQEIVYLTRNNWTKTLPSKSLKLKLTEQLIDDLQLVTYDASKYDKVKMPTFGADNGLSLYDMIGLDYNDPKWDKLLDQMTYDEMVDLIGDSFHWTMPIESINAPETRDENGPQGLTASLFGADGEDMEATAFTSEDVMAATFNTDLMAEIGKVIGNNCLSAGITLLYGPGNNIHRTPYGGRNFEYYSEDGFLSGKMCAYEVAQIEAKGTHVVMKHFALNDSEQDRIGLGVWLGEQAAREIYLKAFQDVFEEGNAGGTMVAYTRWGATWSGAFKGLMSGVMREEWGSNGLSITDNVLTKYVNGVDGVMAGGVSTFDAMLWYVKSQLPKYEDDPVVATAMREACHHNLYGIANSSAMNGIGPKTQVKRIVPSIIFKLRVAMVIFILLFIVSFILNNKRKKEYNKANPKPKK